MLTAISYKIKQFWLALIKLSLVVAAFYFIYTKLFENENLSFSEFSQNLMNVSSISTITILILMFLSILNWCLEIRKWQSLVSSFQKISFKDAKSQTLGALTASLLTPNRIGDYGAKAMYYHSPFRKKIMFLNFLGNAVQMGMTTIFGAVGYICLVLYFQPELNYESIFIWFAIIGFTGLGLFLAMKFAWQKNKQKAMYKLFDFLKNIATDILFKVAVYAMLRYLIFSFQFYYLLLLFGVEMRYFEAMMAISSTYLLASIIPSIFIFDVIIKSGIAVYVFGLMGVPELIVLSVVSLMWLTNFALPSIIGSYHVLSFKLPTSAS